ncbi:MAG TPA: hypothetical protein VGO14_04585 [Solirubrobacteraceae bacterium]|jgi:hypothetical protein|nr:hypothetical protein [Solirubrobacteraceae bacterium]
MLSSASAGRRLLRGLTSIVALVALAAAAVGCGGGSSSNGIASKPAAEILAASRAAALAASSVHLHTTSGEVVLDMKLSSTGGGGKLTLAGATLEMLRAGNAVYLKAPTALYQKIGINAKVPPDTWLKLSVSAIPQLAAFTEMREQLNRLLNLSAVTKGPTATLEGQKVVELQQKLKVFTRSLYVAATGKPYPLELLLKGQVAGKTTLTEWDKPVTLAPPSKSITPEVSKNAR